MAQFAPALAITLQHEGGYSDDDTRRIEYIARHGSDAGYEPTGEVVNRGITHWTLRSLGVLKSTGPATQADKDFVKSLTLEETADIYLTCYWNPLQVVQLNSQDVAAKVFDLAVNDGLREASKLLQSAVETTEDGFIGPATIRAANAMDPALLMVALRASASQYYQDVAIAKPALRGDLAGWLARLNS